MIFKSVESKLFAFANRKQAWRDRRNNTRYGAGGTASGATTHWISSSATNMTMPGRKRSDALRINFTGTRQPGRGLHKQQRRQGSPSRKIREQPHIRRARGLRSDSLDIFMCSDSLDRIHLTMYLRAIMYSAFKGLPGLIMQTLTNNCISITPSHCL